MRLQQALALLERGAFEPAAQTCRAVLAGEPDNIAASAVLGLALGAQGESDAAASVLDAVARARPAQAHPAHALAGLLHMQGRETDIVAQYEACLRLAPDNASLQVALARHRAEAGDAAGVIAALRPVLAADPGHLDARIMTGIALADLGEFNAAETAFRTAVRLQPGEATGWTNLALILKVQGRFDEANEAADRAVALRPDDPQIRLNRAILNLRAGRLAEAWSDYDSRLALPGRGPLPEAKLLRDLAGLPPAGSAGACTLLVVHEDGFGDTLQFIRYAAMLAALGVRVLAWVPQELATLLSRTPGIAEVVCCGWTLPDYDLHCHITDLPRIFATTLDTIPAPIPYVVPDPARVADWAARLPTRVHGVLRVGLAWAGQARPWIPGFSVLDGRRSMSLADLAPLAALPDACFVSLQKGPAAQQTAAPPAGLVIHDPMADIADFDDTAALIANLDVVVSVDTAVAHLAAAMGRPVLLLDRYDNCWRWFAGREDSPWYPSLRILRQERPNEWGPVTARAAQHLAEMARS